jgi:hypothetical protein
MLKRLLTLFAAVALLTVSGCSAACVRLHCEPPCYCCSFQRSTRQMMDVVDLHLLNYDRHDPYRCDPCIGD